MVAQIFADAMKINLIKMNEQKKKDKKKWNEIESVQKSSWLPHKLKWLQNKINSPVLWCCCGCSCCGWMYLKISTAGEEHSRRHVPACAVFFASNLLIEINIIGYFIANMNLVVLHLFIYFALGCDLFRCNFVRFYFFRLSFSPSAHPLFRFCTMQR